MTSKLSRGCVPFLFFAQALETFVLKIMELGCGLAVRSFVVELRMSVFICLDSIAIPKESPGICDLLITRHPNGRHKILVGFVGVR